MKILLLGATGRTGKHLLDLALDHGHIVHALVRNRKKLTRMDSRLQVYEGDPLDKTALAAAMSGCDAVISSLNISRTSDWPWSKLRSSKDFLSTMAKHIAGLAPQNNIRRVIVVSAWGVAETRSQIPGWFRWVIEHSNIRYPYEDHGRAEKILEASPLAFTSVRPAGLTNSMKEKEIIVSFNNEPRPGLLISRRNVARFVLDALEKGLYERQMPVISQR